MVAIRTLLPTGLESKSSELLKLSADTALYVQAININVNMSLFGTLCKDLICILNLYFQAFISQPASVVIYSGLDFSCRQR